jgi:hypothetical protein
MQLIKYLGSHFRAFGPIKPLVYLRNASELIAAPCNNHFRLEVAQVSAPAAVHMAAVIP